MSDQRDRDESAEPTEAKDPTENSEQALPIDPIERNDPTDPIDRAEPFEAMERNEPSERIDQRDAGMAVLSHTRGDRCGGDRGSASYSSP
jgi:hypothetical protein